MGKPLSVGIPAPDFTLPRDGGSRVSLKEFSGRKVVLYFYPKADTPGCTKEAINFNALRMAFAEANTVVLGISADPVKAQDKFRDKLFARLPARVGRNPSDARSLRGGARKACMGKPSWGSSDSPT